MFSRKQIAQSMLLYAVTDSSWLDGRPLADCVREAIEGGATFVQLREKHMDTGQMTCLARELLPICKAAGVPFVINDDVEAAKAAGADGVHVGQSDMACAQARKALGPDAIVGVSVQTVQQALAAQAAGASYLGVGAVIPTPTKPDAVDVTREELMRIVAAVDIPVVAIGGLNAQTVMRMEGTGIQGVAVVSAIFAADDIQAATRHLLACTQRALKKGSSMRSVVSIAGSDTSGGAGIQADIKTIQAKGLFAQTAITALTAQNTMGVTAVHDVPPEFVEQQIDAVFDDIRPDAVKIGMVSSPQIVSAIASRLVAHDAKNIVVDPVMVATSGAALAAGGAVDAMRKELFPLADVITPNLTEAEALCGFPIRTPQEAQQAACVIAAQTSGAVLIKGGHGLASPNRTSDDCAQVADDLLRLADGTFVWLEGQRVDNPNTHGTGCTLSSAIACGLAQGLDVSEAVMSAKAYITGALQAQLDLGKGSGPLDHMWAYR